MCGCAIGTSQTTFKGAHAHQTSRLLAHRISGEADAFYASLACEMAVPFRYIIESGVQSILAN